MTTEEHLELILTFCRSRLALPIGSLNSSASRAGWLATIAAIEGLQQLAQTTVTWMAIHQHTLRAILAAYPLELLTNQ